MPLLDEYDRKILQALQQNGRITIAQLAERVALSATPCSRRLKRLEDEGIITGYQAILEPAKVGQSIEAYVEVNLRSHDDETIRGFSNRIERLDAVVACHAVTGDMDFLLHVFAENMRHFNDVVLKTIVRIDGVGDVRSSLIMDTIKRRQATPIAASL